MRVRLRVFGVTVLTLDLLDYEEDQGVDYLEDVSESDTDGAEMTHGAGETHNFERDLNPHEPIYSPEWGEDRAGRFGFSPK